MILFVALANAHAQNVRSGFGDFGVVSHTDTLYLLSFRSFYGGLRDYENTWRPADFEPGDVLWINCERYIITAVEGADPFIIEVNTSGLPNPQPGDRGFITQESIGAGGICAATCPSADGNGSGVLNGVAPDIACCINNYYALQHSTSYHSGGLNNVTSGLYSFVGAGESNTASATYAYVGAGFGNVASGEKSSIGGGENNTASFLYSTVAGGVDNMASGYAAAVAGGENNTASGGYSLAAGYATTASGTYSVATGATTTTPNYGEVGHNNGISGFGYSRLLLTRSVANATASTSYSLHLNGSTGTVTLPSAGTWSITADYIFRGTTTTAGRKSYTVVVTGGNGVLSGEYAAVNNAGTGSFTVSVSGTSLSVNVNSGTNTGVFSATCKLEILKLP